MKETIAFLALVGALLYMGPFLDAPSEQQAPMDSMSRLAALEAQLEREAARLCLRLKGPGTTHEWDEQYRLVCHPSPVTKTKGSMR